MWRLSADDDKKDEDAAWRGFRRDSQLWKRDSFLYEACLPFIVLDEDGAE
jgi:hypothetical protein